ncbi:hypothetical protein [Haliangium sp.]|uniref:hypothetical protein n=1 Tax=Haliangium sp. TaxID=2663208 RepID=UPI003D0A6A79
MHADTPELIPTIPGPERPTFKLYTAGQIVAATFIGAPLAGAWLMRSNYRALGNPSAAGKALGLGLLATAAVIALAFVVPDKFPNSLIPALYCAVMAAMVKWGQGEQLARHTKLGGERPSHWGVAATGVVSLLALLIGFLGLFFVLPEDVVTFPGGQEVYFEAGATAEHAQQVGDVLQQYEYFSGTDPASVTVSTDGDGFAIDFVLGSDWTDPDIVEYFRVLAHALSQSALGGEPVTVRLITPSLTTMNVIEWQPPSGTE